MLTIPIVDTPFLDLTTNLGGKDYVLNLRYNQREQVFYVSIGAVGGPVYSTVKLVTLWPMFDNAKKRLPGLLPPGSLVCAASGTDNSPPKLGELGPGKRCELIYFEPGEFP